MSQISYICQLLLRINFKFSDSYITYFYFKNFKKQMISNISINKNYVNKKVNNDNKIDKALIKNLNNKNNWLYI